MTFKSNSSKLRTSMKKQQTTMVWRKWLDDRLHAFSPNVGAFLGAMLDPDTTPTGLEILSCTKSISWPNGHSPGLQMFSRNSLHALRVTHPFLRLKNQSQGSIWGLERDLPFSCSTSREKDQQTPKKMEYGAIDNSKIFSYSNRPGLISSPITKMHY